MDEIVSVIVPMHNTADYIKSCLLSVLNQTYTNLELIVINDASTDNSDSVAQKVLTGAAHPRVQYIALDKNVGVGEARNIGFMHASGEFIAFLDSDDWIDTNYIANMKRALTVYTADIAVCGILNEYQNYLSSSIRYYYETTHRVCGDYALKLLSRVERSDSYITPMVGNKVYRKRFLAHHALRFLSDNCCEDDIFTFSAFANNPQVVLVSDTWQHYRQREGSIMHRFSKKRVDDLIGAFIDLRKYLQKKNLYDTYKHEFQAFFERCISSTCQSMMQAKLTTSEQKQYVSYLLERLVNEFTIKAVVNYLDLQRIHRFLGIEY